MKKLKVISKVIIGIIYLIFMISIIFCIISIRIRGTTGDIEREAIIVSVVHEHNADNACYKNGKHKITGDYGQIHKVTFKFDDGKKITKYCDNDLYSELFNTANENVGKHVICSGYYIHKYILPKEYIVLDIKEVLD